LDSSQKLAAVWISRLAAPTAPPIGAPTRATVGDGVGPNEQQIPVWRRRQWVNNTGSVVDRLCGDIDVVIYCDLF
jgi:hypothetical protein